LLLCGRFFTFTGHVHLFHAAKITGRFVFTRRVLHARTVLRRSDTRLLLRFCTGRLSSLDYTCTRGRHCRNTFTSVGHGYFLYTAGFSPADPAWLLHTFVPFRLSHVTAYFDSSHYHCLTLPWPCYTPPGSDCAFLTHCLVQLISHTVLVLLRFAACHMPHTLYLLFAVLLPSVTWTSHAPLHHCSLHLPFTVGTLETPLFPTVFSNNTYTHQFAWISRTVGRMPRSDFRTLRFFTFPLHTRTVSLLHATAPLLFFGPVLALAPAGHTTF